IINAQVDDLTSHNTQYTSPALAQKVFANMRRVRKGFLRVETPLFASMLVQPQLQDAEEEDEIPTAPTTPSLPMLLHHLLNKILPLHPMLHLQLHHYKHNQLQLVTLLWGKIEAIDPDEDITLVDVETQVDMDVKLHWRIDQDVSAATKDVSAVEPTVFDDEEVTINMAQTLIKMKEKKAKLLDEQMAQRLHDEEIEKAAAREKQEKDDLERAKVLQMQYEDKEKNID
nr:hypothetical protein [Tanacetum cinerariifolium]